MLTGEPPHAGADVMEVLSKKATEPVRPVRELNPEVAEPLERVVLSCLDRSPDRRPPTMSALEYDLTKSVKGRGTAVAAALGIAKPDDARPAWMEEGRRRSSGNMPAVMPVLPPTIPPSQPTNTDNVGTSLFTPQRRLVLGAAMGVLAFALGLYLTLRPRPGQKPPVVATAPAKPEVAPPPPPEPESPAAPQAPQKMSAAEIDRLLEWARRTAEGGRIFAPPGDNLKELLERIETADPGNKAAESIREHTAAMLSKKAGLAAKRGRLDEAEGQLKALVVLKPHDERARLRLSNVLTLRAGQLLEHRKASQALTYVNRALELNPEGLSTRMVLADVYLALGKNEAAADEYQRILSDRPTNLRARRGLQAAQTPKPPPPRKKRR
jgi:hypothetical protein